MATRAVSGKIWFAIVTIFVCLVIFWNHGPSVDYAKYAGDGGTTTTTTTSWTSHLTHANKDAQSNTDSTSIPSTSPVTQNPQDPIASPPKSPVHAPPLADNPLLQDISNSTLGFEDIFVVSLPERTDRRDGMVLAAAMSDFTFKFIDGVKGPSIPDKVIPTAPDMPRPGEATLGSWRGHMDAIKEIISRNLTSALIMEDDIDWDVRLKSQLRDFAMSTQALTQPLRSSSKTTGAYADPTFPHPQGQTVGGPDIMFDSLPETVPATTSPYGDDWDLLWIGHCGQHFAFGDNPDIPRGRVINPADPSVPERRYLWNLNSPFRLIEEYPDHTRTTHHSQEGVCTLAYAVSQKGARKLMQEVGQKPITDAYDLLLRYFCNSGNFGRKSHRCLTLQPALFQHHLARGPLSSASDIGNHGGGFREVASTDMIRWSVRLNTERILDGVEEMWDALPDS